MDKSEELDKSQELDPFPQGKSTFAMSFDPIIQQRTYDSKDIMGLLKGVAILDLSSDIVLLKPFSNTYLNEMEASPAFKLCLKEYEPRLSVKPIKRKHFHCLPLRVENVIIALSVSLWRTTLRSNDLIEALRERFLSGLDEKHRSKKNKLPVRMLFRFLNEMSVDVVVMSMEKEKIAVFRAKSSQQKPLSESNDPKVGISPAKERTLVALEFDAACGIWSPLQLSPPPSTPLLSMVSHGKQSQVSEQETFDETRSQSQALSTINMMRSNATPLTFELGQSSNMDTMVFDRTVYNPQMVPLKANGDVNNLEDGESGKENAQHSPFAGMRYPNINQLDLQLWEVLRRGLHPALRRNRIRCIVTFPLALIAFCLGLALIIYLRISLKACFNDTSTDVCVYANEETSIENCTIPFFNNTNSSVLDESVNAFLFGYAASPGTFIVAVTCCMFAAALMAIGVNYFTTRAIATGSTQPLFYIIIMVAHVILGVVGCSFSAYALYVLSHESHQISCSWFDNDMKVYCMAAMNICPGIMIEIHLQPIIPIVLTLSILLLCFCSVQFIVSLVPPMPDHNTIAALEKAKSETYVFYPSAYAPDGISKVNKLWLRARITRRLRMQLREEVKLHNFLLTRNATIGEMMRANRAQSLGEGEYQETTLHKQQEQKWLGESLERPLHYMVMIDESNNVNGFTGKQHQHQQKRSNEERVAGESKRIRREIPSKLLTEVEEISHRVKASKKELKLQKNHIETVR
ncbi:uncharacterized protein TM35_000042220 [Trypanosoma theileri]|uniref:Uncharacterized protein n=1 Tax=Trypanosoma theileri TaxID=67003 RepID=A0A1X0P592_9TRYP|nr:uncharacterized protein TM35_000042220 [Trypanosoma theileri]ORC92008.1 hypothetical protein TM35_000042220 [Trypanosoma theileri]